MNSSINFHGVTMTVSDFAGTRNAYSTSSGEAMWRKIMLTGRTPDKIIFTVDTSGREEDEPVVERFWFNARKEGEPKKVTGQTSFTMAVPVRWSQGYRGVDIPHTRETGKDNVDLLTIYKDGSFVQEEWSIVTWRGKFFQYVEKIFLGQAVKKRGGYDVVALEASNAYPGASFSGIWDQVGDLVTRYAAESIEKVMQKHKVPAVAWNPPEVPNPKSDQWHRGVVMYFNGVTGTGRVWDIEDQQSYFVHRKAVEEEHGDLPVLESMTAVHFLVSDAPVKGQLPPIEKIHSVASVVEIVAA